MFKLVRAQSVPSKEPNDDLYKIIGMVRNLAPVQDEFGDCVETDFNAENVRQPLYRRGIKILIRQIDEKKWRIWRIA